MNLVEDSLEIKRNIYWQTFSVNKSERAELKKQKPVVLWFTGLSASGKTTIANLVEQKLYARDKHTFLLDGDNVRHGLSKDLDFTDPDRIENIRRIAETSKLMTEAGLIVLVSFISPFLNDRLMARTLMEKGEFVEIYINAPIEVCISRDPKGLYKKARQGEIKNFTGISANYEAPENPQLDIDTSSLSVDESVKKVLNYILPIIKKK